MSIADNLSDKQSQLHAFRQLGAILSRKQKKAYSLLILASLVGAILEVAAIGMMLPFMNSFLQIGSAGQGPVGGTVSAVLNIHDPKELTMIMACILVCLYIIKGAYQIFVQYSTARIASTSQLEISLDIFKNFLGKPYIYYLNFNSAELQRITTTDLRNVFFLINSMLVILTELSVSAGIILFLFSVNPFITVCAMAFIICIILFSNRIIHGKARKIGEVLTQNLTGRIKWQQQAIGSLKLIYAMRKQGYFINQYARHVRFSEQAAARYLLLSSIPRQLTENSVMACIFGIMAVLVAYGEALDQMLPTLATFALAAVRLMPTANRITTALSEISYKRPSLEAVHRLLCEDLTTIQSDAQASPMRLGVKPEPLRQGLEVKNATFVFPGEAKALFENLSLTVPANASVALVGVTGAGKTTLADIILGLHTLSSGQVLVDGLDISEHKDWWADRVAYIPQHIYLFDDSIRVNVAFGCAAEEIDDARVWQCLNEAQLQEFVAGLPQGLDTLTGENGIRLSGGQRQRLGIARALYANPAFLVMDEATSALDNETEEAVMKTITELSGKLTLLIIAHRLTTIAGCDYVYCIENGCAILEKISGIRR